jgi:hypothetical protein
MHPGNIAGAECDPAGAISQFLHIRVIALQQAFPKLRPFSTNEGLQCLNSTDKPDMPHSAA